MAMISATDQTNVTDVLEDGVGELVEGQGALGRKVDARASRIEGAVEDGVTELAEGQDALGRKIGAEHARTGNEIQILANEIHSKVVEPYIHITLAQNPRQSAEEPPLPPQHDGDLATWLKKIGLEKFIHKFYDDAGIISLDELCNLGEEEVNEVINVCKLFAGFKRRFIQGLADYKNQTVEEEAAQQQLKEEQRRRVAALGALEVVKTELREMQQRHTNEMAELLRRHSEEKLAMENRVHDAKQEVIATIAPTSQNIQRGIEVVNVAAVGELELDISCVVFAMNEWSKYWSANHRPNSDEVKKASVKLLELTGDRNSISNLPQYASILVALKVLDLSGCSGISGTLESISKLAQLTYLSLDNCQKLTGTLAPLAGLSQLKELDLRGTKFTGTLAPLAGLSQLQSLYLNCTKFTGTLAPLAGLSQLKGLGLVGTKFTGTLKPISGLVQLKELYLYNCQKLTGTLVPLAGLSQLESLNVSHTNLTGTLAPLAGLSQLQSLNVSWTKLTGIEDFKRASPDCKGTKNAQGSARIQKSFVDWLSHWFHVAGIKHKGGFRGRPDTCKGLFGRECQRLRMTLRAGESEKASQERCGRLLNALIPDIVIDLFGTELKDPTPRLQELLDGRQHLIGVKIVVPREGYRRAAASTAVEVTKG